MANKIDRVVVQMPFDLQVVPPLEPELYPIGPASPSQRGGNAASTPASLPEPDQYLGEATKSDADSQAISCVEDTIQPRVATASSAEVATIDAEPPEREFLPVPESRNLAEAVNEYYECPIGRAGLEMVAAANGFSVDEPIPAGARSIRLPSLERMLAQLHPELSEDQVDDFLNGSTLWLVAADETWASIIQDQYSSFGELSPSLEQLLLDWVKRKNGVSTSLDQPLPAVIALPNADELGEIVRQAIDDYGKRAQKAAPSIAQREAVAKNQGDLTDVSPTPQPGKAVSLGSGNNLADAVVFAYRDLLANSSAPEHDLARILLLVSTANGLNRASSTAPSTVWLPDKDQIVSRIAAAEQHHAFARLDLAEAMGPKGPDQHTVHRGAYWRMMKQMAGAAMARRGDPASPVQWDTRASMSREDEKAALEKAEWLVFCMALAEAGPAPAFTMPMFGPQWYKLAAAKLVYQHLNEAPDRLSEESVADYLARTDAAASPLAKQIIRENAQAVDDDVSEFVAQLRAALPHEEGAPIWLDPETNALIIDFGGDEDSGPLCERDSQGRLLKSSIRLAVERSGLSGALAERLVLALEHEYGTDNADLWGEREFDIAVDFTRFLLASAEPPIADWDGFLSLNEARRFWVSSDDEPVDETKLDPGDVESAMAEHLRHRFAAIREMMEERKDEFDDLVFALVQKLSLNREKVREYDRDIKLGYQHLLRLLAKGKHISGPLTSSAIP